MPVTEQVVEQIANDVKKFGETAEGLRAMNDNAKRELGELRAELDKYGNKLDAISVEKIDKIAASVEAQDAALDGLKALPEQVERIDATLKRPGFGAGWKDDEAVKEAKAAFDWHKAVLVSDGKYAFNTEIEPDTEAYAEYKKSYSAYLRAREGKSASFQAALSTGSDPDGGYMVPTERSARVIEKVYETSALRGFATVETISGKELIIPRDEGEFGYGWIGETEAPSETTTSQFGESKIAVHEMYAEPRATQQMLEDAGFDIEGWIDRKVGDKFGRVEAAAFFNGDGVNKPRGLLTYAAGTSNKQIEQIASGAAAAVTADGIYNLVFSLKDYYTTNARFMMKRTTVRDVLKLKDGDGQYMWQMGDIRTGQPNTLLGFPVSRAEDMPTVEASALAIAFGDFSMAYTIVDRLGITLLRDNLTAKPYVKFYNRRRVGGDVVNFEAVKLQKIAAS
ncbi:MAG: phage major capsid protein [Ahrensia sp.]|nr:phage major capsid protein [Ahrensia sp.]MBV48253.1 phage major capsid protein [Roseobacter sp.]|tara:strand:- start:125473 stop:126828 length:1356 start_codon:yes stop_codon:yes gene_type:complete